MKYKVGDKVRIKSRNYIEKFLEVTQDMLEHCEMIMTINDIHKASASYTFKEDCHKRLWSDDMIDCLVERNGKTYPYKIGDRVVLKGNDRYATITDLKYNSWGNLSYYIKIDNDKDICIDYPTDLLLPYDKEEIERENEDKIFSEGYDQGYEDGQHDINEWVLPEGFQFKDENGNVINAQKIVLEKKDNGYPETYEECVEILGRSADVTYGYKNYVLHTLQMLLVCRDAYLQIAGAEMGLDESWEPDWEDDNEKKYTIYTMGNKVIRHVGGYIHAILAFPTEKMRDTFYENFKDEIDKCKELL